MLDKELFRKRLTALRKRQRRPRYIVSELCGLGHDAIGRYERGERVPDVESLVALADYFGVSVDYLLGIEKESRP